MKSNRGWETVSTETAYREALAKDPYIRKLRDRGLKSDVIVRKPKAIREVWYKRSRRNKPIASYDLTREKDTLKLVKGVIYKDPILKKYPKHEKAAVQHELIEIRLREKGYSKVEAHNFALRLEPKLMRNKNVRDYWRNLK